MDALELITLGRQLTKIGQVAMRGGQAAPLPAGHALVLRDVLAYPGSSIADITRRTELAQSIVSKAVSRFVSEGIVETAADPADGRRTLATVTAGHVSDVRRKGTVSADAALAAALGEDEPPDLTEVLSVLHGLAARLRPAQSRTGRTPDARGRPG